MEQKEEYNVIWIDDEWDTIGKAFIQICEKRHKIHIKAFKTRREGMDALEHNLKFWDAVILDAKAFNNSSTNEVADVDGLYEAIRQIERLKSKKHIPYFVLTRQPDLMDDRIFEQSVGKFYKKDTNGQSKLLADLKEEVGNSPRHQLKMQYNDVMERLYSLDIEAGETILDILEAMHFPNNHPDFDPNLYYNKLRQILEYNFRKANEYGILPDECIPNGIVNLNQSYMYLSGRDAEVVGVRCSLPQAVFPKHLQKIVSLILNLGNNYSHTPIPEIINPRILLFSLALQTCEVTLWLDKYIDSNRDVDKNKKMCMKTEKKSKEAEKKDTEINDKKGIVEEISGNRGFCHIGKYCISRKWVDANNCLGKTVEILKFDSNTNDKLKDDFPYFTIAVKIINSLEDIENGSK